jgi:hypothetical protein
MEYIKLIAIFIAGIIMGMVLVVIFAIKTKIFMSTLSKVIADKLMILFYGEEITKNHMKSNTVSYHNYYNMHRSRPQFDYNDILIATRGEAEKVLSNMEGLISEYGMVSVADFYDMVGIPNTFRDNKLGWTDLKSASIKRSRNGYQIEFPEATIVDLGGKVDEK